MSMSNFIIQLRSKIIKKSFVIPFFVVAVFVILLFVFLIIPKSLNVKVQYGQENINLADKKFEFLDTSKSSFVRGAWYDSANQYLVIKLNDTYYEYCGLPSSEWVDFKNAASFGREYDNHIKSLYDCKNDNDLTNKYLNHDLQFSVNLPEGWLQSKYEDFNNVPNSISGAIDIVFSNMPQPEDGFNVTNMPDNFEAISLRVLDMGTAADAYTYTSKKNDYQQEFLPLLDSLDRSTKPLQITSYQVKGGKSMVLYVEETDPIYLDAPNDKEIETPSLIHANAFYKGTKYAYWFSIYERDKLTSKKLIENVLKPILSSFQDLS